MFITTNPGSIIIQVNLYITSTFTNHVTFKVHKPCFTNDKNYKVGHKIYTSFVLIIIK